MRFTSDPTLIHELTQAMELSSENAEEWSKVFVDRVSQNKWLQIMVETDYHGGGHPILMKLPEPSQAELISIALTSNSKDEVATAASLLNYNERDLRLAFRKELMDFLEEHTRQTDFKWTKLEQWRIPTIIEECDLADGVNRRPIIGKKDSEIEGDFRYFQAIAERAKRLIRAAKGA